MHGHTPSNAGQLLGVCCVIQRVYSSQWRRAIPRTE